MRINSYDIAILCHEVNRSYCRMIGDFSQKKWHEAEDWQKESAVHGVKAHLKGEMTAGDSHRSWMQEKLDGGWVYGEEKCAEKKTHPCLVPFEELPLEEQVKDHLFGAVVEHCKGLL